MLALALDSSTARGSVAIGDGERVLGEHVVPVPTSHSESMLPAIHALLDTCGLRVGDVEAIVVGSGPGSFTGLRIGAALAKGLSFARGVPLFAYPSLAAVFAGSPVDGHACAMFDARGDRVYAATFESTAPLRCLAPPRRLRLGDLLAELGPLDSWTFGGEGATKHSNVLRKAGARLLSTELSRPEAVGLLRLLREQPAGRVLDVSSWEPEYLLPPAPERPMPSRRRA
ncbi:MAG: tRNA (adenosine(37)-N6)-threonylcarbamoyltransferase complex dimerization subunit type 1 TsaB [Gemmatimonadota bacterium]